MLLPYNLKNENESWIYSQHYVSMLAKHYFSGSVLIYGNVNIVNGGHREYPRTSDSERFKLFLDKWFRITLRFNFSKVNISASIYPPLNKTHHCNPHKITFRTGGQVPSKHYTNRNNHIFILTASLNIQTRKREKV